MVDSNPIKTNRAISAGKWSVGLGATIVFLSQTSPEVARSNIAAWLHVIGIDRVPQALASATTDNWFTVFGIVEVVLSVLFVLWMRGLKFELEELARQRRRGIYAPTPRKLISGPLGWYFNWLRSRVK
jgi:hypothetical protein